MTAQIYFILMIVFFLLAGVGLFYAIFLFFRNRIVFVISELNGKNRRKQIAEYREKRAQTEKEKKKRKISKEITYQNEETIPLQELDENDDTTVPLQLLKMETIQTEETTVLYQDDDTVWLEQSDMRGDSNVDKTEELNANQMDEFIFEIEQDIVETQK